MEVWQENFPPTQSVGAAKVEVFLREHLQPVSNAPLLEIRAKEHLSHLRSVQLSTR